MTLEDVLANDDFLALRAPEGRRVGGGSVSPICDGLASIAVWMIACVRRPIEAVSVHDPPFDAVPRLYLGCIQATSEPVGLYRLPAGEGRSSDNSGVAR